MAAIEGGRHFGVAAKTDGTVWGWGYNNAGQLGTGTTTKPTKGELTPVQSKFSGGGTQGGRTSASYAYNGDGLRTAKTTGGATQAFVWAVADALPSLLSEGTTTFIYGPNGAFKQIDGNGVATYLHPDQIGSTRLITDATGGVVATYTFDGYGNQTAKTGSANTPLGFTGQYTDAETGFQYLRARYYDPATAQFLTRDPIESITREAYGYVGGNPLNRTDPMGLCWGPGCWAEDAVGAVAAVARSGPAQAVKGMANVASTVTGGIAAVSATAAVVLPFTAPVTGPVAFLAEGVSFATGAAATAIECADGGSGFDCLAGLAATSIPGVTFPLVKQVARRNGDRASRLLNAGMNNLGFAANGAALARNQRERQSSAQPFCP